MIARTLFKFNLVLILVLLAPRISAQGGPCTDVDVANALRGVINLLDMGTDGLNPAGIEQIRSVLMALGQNCYPEFFVSAPQATATEPPTQPSTAPPPPPATPDPGKVSVGSTVWTYQETPLYDSADPNAPQTSRLFACRSVTILDEQNQRYLLEYQSRFADNTSEVGWVVTDAFAGSLSAIRVDDPDLLDVHAVGYLEQAHQPVRYGHNELRSAVPFTLETGSVVQFADRPGNVIGWVLVRLADGSSVYIIPSTIARAMVNQSLVSTYSRVVVRVDSRVEAATIEEMYPGRIIKVEATSPDGFWLRVTARERQWAPDFQLEPRPIAVGQTVEVAFDSGANVRDAPDINLDPGSRLNFKDSFVVAQVSPDGQWLRIQEDPATPADVAERWVNACGVKVLVG